MGAGGEGGVRAGVGTGAGVKTREGGVWGRGEKSRALTDHFSRGVLASGRPDPTRKENRASPDPTRLDPRY